MEAEKSTPAIGTAVEAEDAAPFQRRVGIHGYLKIVGLFFVYFITLGQLAAFSTYQGFYEEHMLASYSPSSISWIGTSQVFLLGIVGLLSGASYDRGYVRENLIPGFILVVLGLLLLSFSHQFWHVLLSQGFLIGIGGALVYIPAISIVSHNFANSRALALGIAASGSAIGGVVFPVIFQNLLLSIGFAWLNRVLALVVLVLSIASYFALTSGIPVAKLSSRKLKWSSLLTVFTPRPKVSSGNESDSSGSPHKHSSALLVAFKGRAYQFLCVGVFFALLGYWVPLFYLVPYASGSAGTTTAYSSYLLSILNAASLFGRILPAAAGNRLGAANILLAGATILGILLFAWIRVASVAGITAWSIFLGFVAGSVITIPNAVASRLSESADTGKRIGFMWAVGAVAELIGPPIAGALVKEHDGRTSYFNCQIFSGVSVVAGAAFLVFPAWAIWKEDRAKRAEINTQVSP
ncbi:MFS general substrate transporter [Nemania sp. FL0916]|nr:MFS general substrate transporter [Nemania sp. FL0916]